MLDPTELGKSLSALTGMKENRFHPFVWIVGEPQIGEGVYIGGFSQVNAKDAKVVIGDFCDIGSYVNIVCADSHKLCIGLAATIERTDILIEDHVFIGSHSVVKGGARIGHHSVVAAGTIVGPGEIPPYSLVAGNPMIVKAAYYKERLKALESQP
jgi:acetyltransferase-like isoleucine patch superfamily enzyme